MARDTEADYRAAVKYCTLATQIDSNYALAWAKLSLSFTDLAIEYLDPAAAKVASDEGRRSADKALEISPELALGHIARGAVLREADLNWRGADAEMRYALTVSPNDPEAQFRLSMGLAAFGQLEPAIKLVRQALTTDPLDSDWYSHVALYLTGVDRLDEAEAAAHRAIELEPGASEHRQVLTIIEVKRGNAQAALDATKDMAPGLWKNAATALAAQLNGDRNAADAAVKQLIKADASTSAYQIAQIYAVRGDTDKTFEWLDRAWSNRDLGFLYLLYDPFIRRYKDDPRFVVFCRKAGLPVPGEPEKDASI
jgi:tetratricopeptide (TPR) repeat protein